MCIYQSTLPREERPYALRTICVISIFQSTLPREERHLLHIVFCYMILYFNPRSHERSDPVLSSVPLGSVPISIHAPTRGATETGAHQSNEFVFQSTLPREERRYIFDDCTHIWYFNPRSHERSDFWHLEVTRWGLDFNPRSHERSDKPLYPILL